MEKREKTAHTLMIYFLFKSVQGNESLACEYKFFLELIPLSEIISHLLLLLMLLFICWYVFSCCYLVSLRFPFGRKPIFLIDKKYYPIFKRKMEKYVKEIEGKTGQIE